MITLQSAIEKLERQRKDLDSAIELLKREFHAESHKVKARKIISSLKAKSKRHGLHWTQRPENRAKMMKFVRKMLRTKRLMKAQK